MYLICGWNSMVNRHDSTVLFIERPLNLPIFTFDSVKGKAASIHVQSYKKNLDSMTLLTCICFNSKVT